MGSAVKKAVPVFFLTCLMLSAGLTSGQGTWERIEVPTRQFLRSVFFTDSLYGWVAGDSGTMIHTRNGGKSWSIQNTRNRYDLSALFFLDRQNGWASCLNYTDPPFGTILLKTGDGGENWIPIKYPDENIFITCMLFRDSLNGWMGGKPHAIVSTRDGGKSWNQAHVDTSILAFFPVLSIEFYDDKYGYASGGMFDIAGVIWRTHDGGSTWYAIDAQDAPADEVHGLHLFDSIRVMGAGGDPDFGYGVGMIRTGDGGIRWNYEELDIQGNAHDIDFRNATEAWAPLGPRAKLIYSLDAGTTWSAILSPDSACIYKMTFPDSLHGYAVGAGGAFLKYHPKPLSAIGPLPGNSPPHLKLYQNQPNPCSGTTTLRFYVPAAPGQHSAATEAIAGGLFLELLDVTGRRILLMEVENPNQGENQLSLDLSTFPKGIYLYRLTGSGRGIGQTSTDLMKLVVM